MQRQNGIPMSIRTVPSETGKYKRVYNRIKPLTPYMKTLIAEEESLKQEAAGKIPPVKLMKEIMHLLHYNGQMSHLKIAQTLQISQSRLLIVLRKLQKQGIVRILKGRRAYKKDKQRQKVWQVVGLD